MSTQSRRMVFGRYDYAAFFTFSSYAACSLVIPVVLVDLAKELNFPLNDGGMSLGGLLHMTRSVAICIAMGIGAFLAARWGNRRTIGGAVLVMALGILWCAITPNYLILLLALLITGLGEGVIEGMTTPFVQELHPQDSGRYVNFSHGFWSLGVLLGVPFFGYAVYIGIDWRWVVGACGLFSMIPVLLLLLPSRKSYVESIERISAKEVCGNALGCFSTPRFWLLFVAIFMAGGGEFCLTFWCASFLQLNFGSSALLGGIATAIFAMGMFLGRTGFGFLISQKSLYKLLVITGVIATFITSIIPIISEDGVISEAWLLPLLMVILFFSGISIAPFWPTIQSYAVDRMPQLDSTMVFILLSCAGVPGCGVFTYIMGILGDQIGLRISFYLIPISFLFMTILIIGDKILYHTNRVEEGA